MEIVDPCVGLLTNYEVLQSLESNRYSIPNWDVFQNQLAQAKIANDQPATGNNKNTKIQSTTNPTKEFGSDEFKTLSSSIPAPIPKELAWKVLKPLEQTVWVREMTINYLLRTPAAHQNSDCISSFMSAIRRLLSSQKITLTRSELLQLINLRPSTLVELHRAIEECEERMTDEQVIMVLNCIEKYLPAKNTRQNVNQQTNDGQVPAFLMEVQDERKQTNNTQ